MIPRRALGVVIAVWALSSWGGRVGLLTGPESADPVVWLRIVGSLGTAAIAGWALWRSTAWLGLAAWLYAVTAGSVWVTSLVSVWTDRDAGAGFRIVHTALALVSLSLALLTVLAARQPTGATSDSAAGTAAVS